MSARGFLSRLERSDSVQGYRRPVERDRWFDPDYAPFGRPVRCEAEDHVGPYVLPFRCIKTASGWINVNTGTPLHLVITGWRP